MRSDLIISLLTTAALAFDSADLFLADSFPVDSNEMPTIGILSQQLADDMLDDPRFAQYDSYIMAAYVKFMEAAGARVVPLVMGEDLDLTMEKMSMLDGVLFPGGGGDYLAYGQPIYDKILEYNDAGKYFPAWGTCLGFEALA